MYHIDLTKDKPDVGYMEAMISKLMSRGLRVKDCAKLRDHYNQLHEILKKEFIQKYQISNPNSTKQLSDYLKKLSNSIDISSTNDIINICYDNETGKWTTNASAMEKLADLGYEFASDLMDYRHAKKYAEAVESIMVKADANGLVHPEVTLAKTHRINYSNPGIMTIPKDLLWHMLAPITDGNLLYSVDIKNQEPSILINMVGADELKYALESKEGLYETMFKQCFKPCVTANVLIDTLPDDRVYSNEELREIGTVSPAMYSSVKPQSSEVYYGDKKVVRIETICMGSTKGVYPELPDTVDIELEDGSIVSVEVEWQSADKFFKKSNDYSLNGELKGIDIKLSKAERKEFKTAYIAFTYGASAMTLEESCKSIDGKKVYKYLNGIEAIKNYKSSVDAHVRAGKKVICTVFGTPMYAGDVVNNSQLKRTLLNLPIQGTAADILSLLIKRFYSYTSEHGLEDKLSIYCTRHDELIIEVDKDWHASCGDENVEAVLRDMLEHQINNWTPFKVEVNKVVVSDFETELEN